MLAESGTNWLLILPMLIHFTILVIAILCVVWLANISKQATAQTKLMKDQLNVLRYAEEHQRLIAKVASNYDYKGNRS